MTIKQIYNLAIELGSAADPRGKKGLERALKIAKEKYQKLSKEDRELFDKERLTNPYADTRILFGDPNTPVKTILAGIEAEEEEIALAKALNLKVDLVITHHPQGKALAALEEVMNLQADLLASQGVPINVAEGVMRERIDQVGRSLSVVNHQKAVDAARITKIPYLCTHTVCDNLVYDFLTKWLSRKQFDMVGELVDALKKIPEYKIASQNNAGPRIFAGSPENRAGKIVALEVTGGTEGAKEVYEKLSQAGIGTIIGMHMKDENREEALKNHLNVVIAGHISSDSIGMNLFLDKLQNKGLKIIPAGGLIRVRRGK